MDRPPPAPAVSTTLPATSALRHLRSEVRGMQGYTPGEQVRDCIKLNTNECPWEPSPGVLDTLKGISGDALRLYPDPLARGLRESAAARYGVSAAQVLAGNGSDDCLTIIYRAFLRPGERVACPWPTYGLYDTLAVLQNAEMIHVDFRARADAWLMPSSLARQAAKLVLIANPNNPSGTLIPVEALRQLAYELDGILVVDEAYVDFAPQGSSLLPFLDQHPNLLILRTFSKSYSLAGARLGLMFGHRDLIDQLVKVKDSYNVNMLSQQLGVQALEDHAYHADLVARTLRERSRLAQGLAALGWSWPESAANFLLCEVGAHAGEVYRHLKSRGILVRWWDTDQLRSKLRITVGRPEWSDALLGALGEILATVGR